MMETAKKIYFLGIGGIGMSALAHYYLLEGCKVYGYDRTPSPITDKLTSEGALIHFEENPDIIPQDIDFVIYTPAISKDNKEYVFFSDKKTPIYKRAQVLGMITDKYRTAAVAGTHGKTTTTSMLAHILNDERNTIAFIGGIAKNFDSNFVLHPHPEIAVVEADEFDRSFLTLHPAVAIITSMDADHLDIYGSKAKLEESFNLFATQVSGTVVTNENIAPLIRHSDSLTYGFKEESKCRATNITAHANITNFIIHYLDETPVEITLPAPGKHNVLNATAAYAAARLLGIEPETIRKKLATFSGVKRRFDYQIERPDLVFIDDYAHHPEELRSIITSVKEIYNSKKLTVVFQPHLYTRTRDFAHEFAEVLSIADKIILLPIYPARELPIQGIDSQYLLNLIENNDKILLEKKELLPYLKKNKPEVLLTLGAGDIDRLVPVIKEELGVRS